MTAPRHSHPWMKGTKCPLRHPGLSFVTPGTSVVIPGPSFFVILGPDPRIHRPVTMTALNGITQTPGTSSRVTKETVPALQIAVARQPLLAQMKKHCGVWNTKMPVMAEVLAQSSR